MAAHGGAGRHVLSFETDRLRFVGRGRTAADPRAMHEDGPLSGSEGRCSTRSWPSAAGSCSSRTRRSRSTWCRAWPRPARRPEPGGEVPGPATGESRVRAGLDARPGGPAPAERLRGARRSSTAASPASILYANASLRADPAVIARNRRGQSGLWGYGISGDLPIVLLRIGDAANIELVRQLVQAHAYWRLKGLAVDLVIWNEDRAGYRQVLQEQIIGLIAGGTEAQRARPAGRHLRAAGRADLRRKTASCSRRWRGSSSPTADGSLEEQIGGRPPDMPRRAAHAVPDARERRFGRRRCRRATTWCSSTASAGSRRTDTSTSSRPGRARRRRRPGSTCSRTRASAPSSPRAAAATPGPRTPTSSG